MILKDKISSMTDEETQTLASQVCGLVADTVTEYCEQNDIDLDYCDICPFTKFCSIGKTGFSEFLKQEV